MKCFPTPSPPHKKAFYKPDFFLDMYCMLCVRISHCRDAQLLRFYISESWQAEFKRVVRQVREK